MANKIRRELSAIPVRANLRLVFILYASIPNTNPISANKIPITDNIPKTMKELGHCRINRRTMNRNRIRIVIEITPSINDAIAMLTLPY